jgi:hypothetical protein
MRPDAVKKWSEEPGRQSSSVLVVALLVLVFAFEVAPVTRGVAAKRSRRLNFGLPQRGLRA